MKIGQDTILTMVDSGVTHTFMREETARKIGLKFIPAQAQLKAVNSPPDSVIGIAEKVDVSVGEWIGKFDFMIVRIYDYEVVLGMEFMNSLRL